MPNTDPLSVAERVDAACDSFEREWRAGNRPSAEDYVAAVPETDRDALRSALATMERELKAKHGTGETSIVKESVRSGVRRAPGATVARPKESAGSQDSSATPAEQSAVPSHIGKFQVRAVLGSGAFGCVYRAFDPNLDREVAIKVPLPDSLRTPAHRERFIKEAKAAAAIDHPNICRIHEVGEHEGLPYIVMAFVPGQSLAEVLRSRQEPLPEKQAAIIIRKLALALEAAHKKGVVHRDLKPANIMFDKEKKDLVVMDFGLARRETEGDARATQSGIVMGTPAYMSPEQARGEAKEVGPAGDIFSLGIIMYELLTGTRPFNGTVHEVIGQILLLEPEPPTQRHAGVNPQLGAICLKAMAKDPANRFVSMKEFAVAVDNCLRKPASSSAEAVRAVRTAPNTEVEAEAETGTESTAGVELSTNTSKLADVFAAMTEEPNAPKAKIVRTVKEPRRPWVKLLLLGAAAVLFLAVVVVGGVIFFTKNDKGIEVASKLPDIDLNDKSQRYFLDDKEVSAEELKKPMQLAPNEYVFVVKRGDVIVNRFNLTVTGGRNPGITVRDITPKSTTTPTPPKESASDPQPPQMVTPSPVAMTPTGILVLDDCDDVYKGKAEYKDNLTLLDSTGKQIFRVSGFNNTQSIGSNHKIAADPARKCIWVIESAAHRIRRFDLTGKVTLTIDVKGWCWAIAVDPETGNVWAGVGPAGVNTSKTVVYNDRGQEVATYDSHGFDIVYGRKAKAFWIAGDKLTKISAAKGEVVCAVDVSAVTASSVDVDQGSGAVWVAVRKQPQVRGTKNQLLKFDADGKATATVDLGEKEPFRVSVDPKDGSVWVAHLKKSVEHFSVDGKSLVEHSLEALAVQVDPAGGDVWAATPTEVQKMAPNGDVIKVVRHVSKTSQVYIGSLESNSPQPKTELNEPEPKFTIRDVMKIVFLKDGLRAKCDTAVSGEKWEDAQKFAEQLNQCGLALTKTACPKGDLASWEKLTREFHEQTTAINKAAADKDAKAFTAAMKTFQSSCAACHTAHRPSKQDEVGFLPLFNGKDLTGWKADSGTPDQWEVKGNTIVGHGTGANSRCYLLTTGDYSDFVLRLEYQIEKSGHAAVSLRAVEGERLLPGTIVDHPIIKLADPNLTIKDGTGATHFMKDGKVYSTPTLATAPPAGEWHTLEIVVKGDSLTATFGEKEKLDLKLDSDSKTYGNIIPGLKRAKGKIGLQTHTGTVKYRNIHIKELK